MFAAPLLIAQKLMSLPQNNQQQNCISPAEYNLVENRIRQNIKAAEAVGHPFPNVNRTLAIPTLFWPLKETDNFKDESLYYITNFVDRDNTTGIQDYNCGTRSYDGHNGMDIALAPFGWLMMDNQVSDIIAAAPGVIADSHDGEFDRNCAINFSNPANYVIVRHADGSAAYYWHMKSGTVTTKPVGSIVNIGDYLGKVGSSGASTGPHLHFEIHDNQNAVIDPYTGSCNGNSSLWASQKDYWESGVIKLMTSINNYSFNTCPNQETTNEVNHFIPSGSIRLSVFLRGLLTNQAINVQLFDEQGTQKYNDNYTFTGTNRSFTTLQWPYTFGTSNSGTWKMQVTYNGKVYNHYFTVFCNTYNTLNTVHTGNKGFIAEGGLSSTSTCANSSNVWYEAESEIVLSNGFIAVEGSNFRTNIDNCQVFAPKVIKDKDSPLVLSSKNSNSIAWNGILTNSTSAFSSDSVGVYPNPFTSSFDLTINTKSTTKAQVTIFNSVGVKVKILPEVNAAKGNNKVSVDGSSFAKGIYLVEVKIGEEKTVKKIIKL